MYVKVILTHCQHSSDPEEESAPEEPTPEEASSENIVKVTFYLTISLKLSN